MRRIASAVSILCSVAAAAAADFVVINTSDNGVGSLRQAIVDANAAPGADRVVFSIPGIGVQVIGVGALPPITDSLTIDGYTQPGTRPNNLEVGSNAVIGIELRNVQRDSSGLVVQAGGCAVRGLSLTGFSYGNELTIARGEAIMLEGPGGNRIEGNFIGIRADGCTAGANAFGINVRSAGNVIGGTTPEQRNVISGSDNGGAAIPTSSNNAVIGNYIGTDASGTRAVRNGTGVLVRGSEQTRALHDTIIGGTVKGSGNLISGNRIGVGLGPASPGLLSRFASDVAVQGNLIGTTADGKGQLGNTTGVMVDGSNNLIGGLETGSANVIAFNRLGVVIRGGVANRILSNAMFGNSVINIDLSGNGFITPNDPGDGDTGPNDLQNYPIIVSARAAEDSTVISGELNSTANEQFTIQLFADSTALVNPTQTYIGSTEVATDGNGNARFAVTFPTSHGDAAINATATSATGNTSEFFLGQPGFKNISTRAHVQGGDNVLIGGLIVENSAQVVIRALGPSLTSDDRPVPGALEDPTLELYSSTGALLATNDNWRDDASSAAGVERARLAPTNDLEAAIYTTLHQGAYTAVIRGKHGASGIALVELYHVSGVAGSMPANLSTRGRVQSGDDALIGGMILGAAEGTTRVVARAIGRSLGRSGVANPLADPILALHDSNGATIAMNDDWMDAQQADLEAVGLAPQDNTDAAILIRLAPGAYTAVVRGKADSTGVALVELYNLH